MLLDNPFTNDKRVSREAATLVKAGYQLTLFCTFGNQLPLVENIDGVNVERIFPNDIVFNFKLNKTLEPLVSNILNRGYKIWHCHDQAMLNIGCLAKKADSKITLIYDSHELYRYQPTNPIQKGDKIAFIKNKIARLILNYREKKNAKKIDYLITVNFSISKYFNLKNEPTVLRNIPDFEPAVAGSNHIRKYFNLPQSTKILVFIGSSIFTKTLNLENIFKQIANQPNLALVFICSNNGGKKDLENLVQEKKYSNIYFHPLVAPQAINSYLSSCDVGLVPTWNKKDLSYWFALDNKLFEYLIAEIPILATAQPEYINVVEKNKIGICINGDTPNAYLDGFYKIIKNYTQLKENLVAAKQIINWGIEQQNLIALYEKF
jgi:glycosyltransferase involved in cell wall biosynthesis